MTEAPHPPAIAGLTFLAPIGSGATATVWRARQEPIGREVAVKLVKLGDDDGGGAIRERFRHEAKALGLLSSPHVMKIHHAVETRTLGCIVGELVDGDSLRQHLARGRMTVAAAMRCIQDVLRGLAHVHATGVLHRDIKPSNLILRRSDRRVVLVDFGIARLPASDLTRMGDQMGTAHYVSPEQWRGDEIDIRTDIYAAGATFYHLLTGRPPYGGAPEHALMQKFHTDAPRPSSLVPDVPVALDQVVAEAMAFKPAYRYRTSEEFAVAIARAAAEAPDFARSSGAPVRRTERRSRQGIEARKQGGLLRDLAELFMD